MSASAASLPRAYMSLVDCFRRIHALRHVEAVASWDESTMMPEGGAQERAEALSVLRGVLHEQYAQPAIGQWLADAADSAASLSPWQSANLREMRRLWLHATALPSTLIERMSLAESHCEQAWRRLRPANNVNDFLPLLAEVVRFKREAAHRLSDGLSLDPYDALLDAFEPGIRRAHIDPLFAHLEVVLPAMIQRVVAAQSDQPAPTTRGGFSIERQRVVAHEVLRVLGFDFTRGRMDSTAHPFCGGPFGDVRIALRYDEGDFLSVVSAAIHECGHAKYEQHLPWEWRGQAISFARGACIHESQSLLLEMQVGRSNEFLSFIAPILSTAFQDSDASAAGEFDPMTLHRRLTRVAPSYIRVDADELTYPCHILLRYEIEQGLIQGELQVEDLPSVWDSGMRRLLGISTLGNDRDGCMQDVHWAAGLFGYFPSYLLGALAAAQFFRAATQALPNLMQDVRQGTLRRLDHWLEQTIWGKGSSLSTAELIEHATGAPLSSQAFEAHLRHRYLGID